MTTTSEITGRFPLGDRAVNRMGFGGMKLTGRRLMGPPADPEAALAVLRRAVELGVDHIDTSDNFGPRVVNELIHEALHPYPEDLVIVTKVGAHRASDGAWAEALAPAELRQAVQDNLDSLELDVLDVVNLRMPGLAEPVERSLAEPFEALAEMQQEGLIRHLGVCHVTSDQDRRGAEHRATGLRAEPLQPDPPRGRSAHRRPRPARRRVHGAGRDLLHRILPP
jgi:pyridoxine 4-dehydrogenase